MFPTELTVDLSRMQFAMTAMYHFIFVPLTLGLSWILVVMEALYLKTGNVVYRDMTRFWAKLFAINFAMGVVTGITMEFQFGQNWAYFSRFIGDTFGAALAIEGLTAFMTEAAMFGLFFFTWNKVSKRTHFTITVVMAIATNLSIVNILVANSWMQHPVASTLDFNTMTMQMNSFLGVYTQELAQIRIGHVAMAGLYTGSMFVLGISAYYLLKNRDVGFAKRSFAIAAGMGIVTAVCIAYMGDANGLAIAKDEPAKMAATEGQWHTQTPPASWYIIAVPNQAQETNHYVISIPYALSLIATHSLSGTVEGLDEIMQANQQKIVDGAKAYGALVKLRQGKGTVQDEALFDQYRNVIGYGMLLRKYTDNPATASSAEVARAAKDTIPNVAVCFWAFRFMIAAWGLAFLIFLCAFVMVLKDKMQSNRWLLRAALIGIPLPYIAAESGWVLTEVGRQPWVVKDILPTYLGTSSLGWHDVAFSISGFALFYTLLLVLELFLMFKYARRGPSSLGEGRYHFEIEAQKELLTI